MKLYAYCLMDDAGALADPLTGIANSKVRLLKLENFSVLVSDFSGHMVPVNRENALTHAAVVRSEQRCHLALDGLQRRRGFARREVVEQRPDAGEQPVGDRVGVGGGAQPSAYAPRRALPVAQGRQSGGACQQDP